MKPTPNNPQNSPKTTWKQLYDATMERVAPLPCQETYAKNLAKILSMHINRNILISQGAEPDNLPAPSAIVIAPTGQGKSYILRKMAELTGQNLIIIDSSSLTPEGYKGINLSQRIASARKNARSKDSFLQSILFFDEIDKLKSNDLDWGTQRFSNILQLYNGSTMDLGDEQIPTNRLLILFAGAFVGLDEIIRARISPKRAIGFSTAGEAEKLNEAELLQRVDMADLVKFGILPELLGRIGTILNINPMQVPDFKQLLTAENGSMAARYNSYLQGLYHVKFEISDAAVEHIAGKCAEAATGARAAAAITNDAMRDAVGDVEMDDSICKIILDAEDDKCCTRYEYGPREIPAPAPELFEPAAAELPTHRIRSNSEAAAIRSLMRYYHNAGGNPQIDATLNAYLSCMVPYLHQRCQPQEFTLQNLLELAAATEKEERKKSPFDILMDDWKHTFSPAYKAFLRLHNRWTARELVSAIKLIQAYLWKYHGKCNVQFVVPRGK